PSLQAAWQQYRGPEETSALARFFETSILLPRGLEGRVGTWCPSHAFKTGPSGNSGEAADANKGSGGWRSGSTLSGSDRWGLSRASSTSTWCLDVQCGRSVRDPI